MVSILTRPGGRVQRRWCIVRGRGYRVSILTRPGGRVQQPAARPPAPPAGVSILTRPGGRVQPGSRPTSATACTFQSSPVPEDGCNRKTVIHNCVAIVVSILTRPGGRVQLRCTVSTTTRSMFQSSPVPEDGCNEINQLVLQAAAVRFNPHPSRRTGATGDPAWEVAVYVGRAFQSSPVPEDGCNDAAAAGVGCVWTFQSSPVPEDGCNSPLSGASRPAR